MSYNNNHILNIYKSRMNILNIMEYQGYAVSDYVNFNINQVDAMLSNAQLDMLIENGNTKQKTYIKYYFNSKQIRQNNLEVESYQIHNEQPLRKFVSPRVCCCV